MATIRTINIDDAPAFLDLCLHLDAETRFMMYEPGERSTSALEQRDAIERVLSTHNSTIIVADFGGELGGYVSATGGEFNRSRHVAYIVAGVRARFSGRGIGTALFARLDSWATSTRVSRLELTVRTDNDPAIRLYTRMGFTIEGTRTRALLVDGRFVDELYMAKLVGHGSSH